RGRLAGAGLDVFEREPAVNPKLKGLPNVVLLPHMGSSTFESRADMLTRLVENVDVFFQTGAPKDPVT
ncbi:MAG: NAD(P)-dependent oxidoreductase, partial [Pseudomonadota bacterium]